MLFLPALIAAVAVAQTPSTLTDVAVACNDPSNLAQTRAKLLERGWIVASAEKQSKLDEEISAAIHPDDTLTVAMSVFEKADTPSLLLIVAEERETDGFWMRSCGLRDPEGVVIKDLASVKAAFSLGQHETEDRGSFYSWELWDAKLTYYLNLDPKAGGTTALTIQKYGRN